MAVHPYTSASGSISQMIGFLRKNFPATVNADTVKRLGVAPNNESYVINILQFLGLVDEEGNRTDRGHEVLTRHPDEEFQKAFSDLVNDAYSDLFELRGDDAWTMNRDALIGYFRGADKTSEVIGTRQARVFQVLRVLAGREVAPAPGVTSQTKQKVVKQSAAAKSKAGRSKIVESKTGSTPAESPPGKPKNDRDMALTVRIEINLPAEGTQEIYDSIFKSIRTNLLNE